MPDGTIRAASRLLRGGSPIADIPPGFARLALRPAGFIDANGPLYGRMDEGKFVLGFPVEDRHCNPFGLCHGGMLATLADILLVSGSNLQARLSSFLLTVNLSCDDTRHRQIRRMAGRPPRCAPHHPHDREAQQDGPPLDRAAEPGSQPLDLDTAEIPVRRHEIEVEHDWLVRAGRRRFRQVRDLSARSGRPAGGAPPGRSAAPR